MDDLDNDDAIDADECEPPELPRVQPGIPRAAWLVIAVVCALQLLAAINEVQHESGMHIFPDGLSGAIFDKGGASYDVKAYGATGGGSIDDTAAIQAAADACNNNPRDGIVHFPAGTYRISSTVTFTNCRVVGSGMVNTVIAPTTAVAGTPAIVLAAPSNGGNLRQGGMADMQVTGPSTPALGLHPSSLVDGIRLDASMLLERVRVTGVDKGITTNASTGHHYFQSVEMTQVYYAFYLAHQADNTDGQADEFHDCNLSAAFAIIGIPTNTTANSILAIHGTWGLAPYVVWQEGTAPGTAQMLSGFHSIDVYFEGIGNAVMFSANTAINANFGGILNVAIINPGFTYGSGFNLPASGGAGGSCLAGTGNPYQCCTGAGTGCTKVYGIDVGPIGGTFYEWGGLNPIDFSGGAGGTGAVRGANCTGFVKIERQQSSGGGGIVSCTAHPEFVQIIDQHGQANWQGLTTTDTPVTCVAGSQGASYYDTSLNRLCTCNGTVWCQAAHPANAECTGAGAPAACCSGAGAGTCCNTNVSCG